MATVGNTENQSLVQSQLDELGQCVAHAREEAGLTVEELAKAAGVGVSTIQRMEQGNGGVGLGNLVAVMRHLGLSLDRYTSVVNQDALPLHPLFVDDEEVDDVIEETVSDLCNRLDALFPGSRREAEGISSNFQGLLCDHLRAMLCGEMHHRSSHRIELNTLVYSDSQLGREYSLKDGAEGHLVRLVGTDHVLEDGAFRLARKVSDMYTSWEAAAEAVRKYVKKDGHLPGPVRIVSGWWATGETGVRFTSRAESDGATL
jgi:transcriptional regulator with XRE-family HTH domain